MNTSPDRKRPNPDSPVFEDPALVKTVGDLKPGESGVIAAVSAPSAIKRRLMDMGIIEGTIVEMIRSAPLGDPIVIRVRNTNIALRKKEAETIVIKFTGVKIHGRTRFRHRFGR